MTVNKKVFITGASGNTGRHVLGHLYSEKSLDVHAGICKEDEKPLISKLCPNATIHKIDADHLDSVVQAMHGASGVFIIPTVGEAKVHHGKTYINAAKKAGVKFVLLVSMIGADSPGCLLAEEFKEIESTLLQAEIPSWCIIRSGFYAQNFLLYKQQIKQGVLPVPIGDGQFAPVDADDVGRAAKDILVDCKKHHQKTYVITGPQSMNGHQMAEVAGKVLQKPIKFRDIPKEEARQILLQQNLPDSDVKGLLHFYEQVAKNSMNVKSEDFEKITGASPSALSYLFERHKQELV